MDAREVSPRFKPLLHINAQVYHPNIDYEGNVCLNILREDWKPVLSVSSVIFGLQYLFLDPSYDDPLNKARSLSSPLLSKELQSILTSFRLSRAPLASRAAGGSGCAQGGPPPVRAQRAASAAGRLGRREELRMKPQLRSCLGTHTTHTFVKPIIAPSTTTSLPCILLFFFLFTAQSHTALRGKNCRGTTYCILPPDSGPYTHQRGPATSTNCSATFAVHSLCAR